MATHTMRVGQRVRLKLGVSSKPGPREAATIQLLYGDIDGGVRLDRMLDGFFSWNEDSLERANNA